MCGFMICCFCCWVILSIVTVLLVTSVIPYEILIKLMFEFIIWPYTGYMIAGIPMVIVQEEHRSHTILNRCSKKYFRMVGVYCLGITIILLEYQVLTYLEDNYVFIPWLFIFTLKHFKTCYGGIILAFPNTIFHREKLERIFIFNMFAFYVSFCILESTYEYILA